MFDKTAQIAFLIIISRITHYHELCKRMTGETLEVRSNKRKPRMLLRHRTS